MDNNRLISAPLSTHNIKGGNKAVKTRMNFEIHFLQKPTKLKNVKRSPDARDGCPQRI
jgi:hypothetical protein